MAVNKWFQQYLTEWEEAEPSERDDELCTTCGEREPVTSGGEARSASRTSLVTSRPRRRHRGAVRGALEAGASPEPA